MDDENTIGVLLVRSFTRTLDSSFSYRGTRLPEIGDVIDVTDADGNTVRALVNGLELQKRLPIRAAELTEELKLEEMPVY